MEEYVKSGHNQMVIDPDPDEIYTKRKKADYECYELQSFVITQHEIRKRWQGKISRKEAFIHSHLLTGFPIEGENPWPGEKIQATRVAIVLLPLTMKALYEFLRPGASGENIQYLSSARDDIQAGHSEHSVKQSLKTIDEFFSYIVSPQTGFAEIHSAQLFNVSQSIASRIFISWINFMLLKLGHRNIWPSRELVDETQFKIHVTYQ